MFCKGSFYYTKDEKTKDKRRKDESENTLRCCQSYMATCQIKYYRFRLSSFVLKMLYPEAEAYLEEALGTEAEFAVEGGGA